MQTQGKIIIIHFQFLRQIDNRYRPCPLSPQPTNTDLTHKQFSGRLSVYFHVHKDSPDGLPEVKGGNK